MQEHKDEQLVQDKLRFYMAAEDDERDAPRGYNKSLADMEVNAVNVFDRPVASGIPGLGRLIVLFKKTVRRFIAWYTNPFAEQQSRFNRSVHQYCKVLEKKLAQQQRQNKALQATVKELETRLDTIERGQGGAK